MVMVSRGVDAPPTTEERTVTMHTFFLHATESRKRVLLLTLLAFAALC